MEKLHPKLSAKEAWKTTTSHTTTVMSLLIDSLSVILPVCCPGKLPGDLFLNHLHLFS